MLEELTSETLTVFIVEVLNLMGPSDAEITYGFHSPLPPNEADAFFSLRTGIMSVKSLYYSLTIDVFKIVVLKHH